MSNYQRLSLNNAQQMMEQQIEAGISKSVRLYALGNTNRSLHDLCADLINNADQDIKSIAYDCFLHPTTVKKLAKRTTKFPRADTCERILRHFSLRLDAHGNNMKIKFKNQKKG